MEWLGSVTKREEAKGWSVLAKKGRARRVGTGLMLALCMSVIFGSSPLRAADPLDRLYDLFKVDLPSADVVVLLDASGSMGGNYRPCRQAVVEFVKRLRQSEQLHLRLFGDVPEAPLDEAGDKAAERVEEFVRREPFPMARRGSDLGMAIHKGLEFLERRGASQVQAFFLLTDGLHQVFPAMNSPYSADFDGDPDWQDLYRRGHALSQGRTVFVYGFGLGERTDVALLRRVFPARSVELIPGNAAGVAHVLERVRDRLRREQLRPVVEKELARGKVESRLLRTSISGNVVRFDLPLTVRNAYSRLPIKLLRVDLLRSGTGSREVQCTLEGNASGVVLEPGKEWQGRLRGRLEAKFNRRRLGKEQRRYESQFTLTPVAAFVDEADLRELGVHPRVAVQPASLTVDLTVRFGVPIWIVVGLLVSVGGALASFRFSSQRFPMQCLAGRLIPTQGGTAAVDLSTLNNPATVGPGCDVNVDAPGVEAKTALVTLRLSDNEAFVSLVAEWSHASVSVIRGVEGSPSPAHLESGDRLAVGKSSFLVEFLPLPSRTRSNAMTVVALLMVLAAVGLVICLFILDH